ncbi:hypothetical protein EMA8858_04211 [Emticicia aquatica]|uniref:Uncharacterized protein n=1 Tax=Emticicia aquatica TaxID=1681835 RepID=A0ABM9AW77_9BACT|nr:hypothetical protein [Emticicia aquatica]CAH0998072.1 hypothetical protein EMA8858_04211 [Emticicia aquatica]
MSQTTWRAKASKSENLLRINTRKLRIGFVANGSGFGQNRAKGIARINKNQSIVIIAKA